MPKKKAPTRVGAVEQVGAEGFEPSPFTSGNPASAPEGGAHSGALGGDSAPQPAPATTPDPAQPGIPTAPLSPSDPELAAVVAAWPDLPPAIRAGIVAMVKASGR
ncbi:MAG: hypothetical protein ACKVZJ_04225 [Phycisphaerales bacterium]